MQSKELAIKYKKHYKKDQNNTLCYDKNCQATKKSVCEGKKSSSTQYFDMPPVKPEMKNKDL